MTALQKSQGIDNFFNSLFGFMSRKTDFFADQKNSWAYVDTNYKRWLKKFDDKKEKEAAKKKRKMMKKKLHRKNLTLLPKKDQALK